MTARFPWPGGTAFPAGVVIPLTTPASFFPITVIAGLSHSLAPG